MTRRLAGLASVVLLVAACNDAGTATNGPGGTAQPTPAPVTAAPVVTPAPGTTINPDATFDTSSFHADVDLEDLFPDEVGGEELTVLSMSGEQMMGDGGSAELEAMLNSLGKTPSDLSAAFGGTAGLSIIAFRVAGVPGGNILNALFDAYRDETEASISDASLGGKSVKKITPVDPDEDVSYIYAARDVVFIVGNLGSAANETLLNEAFSKLP